ncbi:MAG TPA: alpha/beta fold hydrolase [Pyrinomonadaceae bacterium]|nr:alpha/beta fold hydrolase [Pyrinomonadaceae bacterium]
MPRRKLISLALFLGFLLLSLPLSAVQKVTPPSQPATGPGGKQYVHASVTKNRYGKGGQEYWIFEPDEPKPASAPVIVFLHGWGGMNPLYYGAWIDHLVKRGNIVIYPRYQASLLTQIGEFTPNTLDAIKNALARLGSEPGHVKADLTKFAAVGHSVGGVLAANVAALASENGLPRVAAVMSVEPGITESPINIPLADLKKIPAETLLLAVAGDQDTLVRDFDAKRIYNESTRVPAKNKDYVTLVSDSHGLPGLVASHRAPTAFDMAYDSGEGIGGGPAEVGGADRTGSNGGGGSERAGGLPTRRVDAAGRSERLETMMVNALDFYGTWKLFDGLSDAAFYGKNREYALGNTPQQRLMGVWSDGVPVKELKVTDKP